MNKKKIIVTGLMTMVLLFFVWLKKQNNMVENDLVLLNIEALALNENGEYVTCLGIGTLDCPSLHSKVYYIRTFNGKK